MKRIVLNRRSATVHVLYPVSCPFDVDDFRLRMASLGIHVSPHQRAGMQGISISFPAQPGALGLEALGGTLAFTFEYKHEGELCEAAFALPFTMFHHVEVAAPAPVVEPRVDVLPGRTARLRVALGQDDNMRIYLHGAHAKQFNDVVQVKPRNATFFLELTTFSDGVTVAAKSASSSELLSEHTFKGPGELHRHLTSVLRIASANQHRDATVAERAA